MLRKVTWLAVIVLLGCNAESTRTPEATQTSLQSQSDGEQQITSVDDDATFETLLASSGDKTVLVDFWAEWCGPCRELGPHVAAIAREYQDRLTVAKVNVDNAPDLASRFEIKSIPTLIVFRNGQEVTRTVGPGGKEGILEMLLPVIH